MLPAGVWKGFHKRRVRLVSYQHESGRSELAIGGACVYAILINTYQRENSVHMTKLHTLWLTVPIGSSQRTSPLRGFYSAKQKVIKIEPEENRTYSGNFPSTRQRYSFFTDRSRKSVSHLRASSCVRATSNRPEVSRSNRCTATSNITCIINNIP